MSSHSTSPNCAMLHLGSWLFGMLSILTLASTLTAQKQNWINLGRFDGFVGPFPYSLAGGDFNGDSKLDLAITLAHADPASGTTAPGEVVVFQGNGDGTFVHGTPILTGSNAAGVVSGDFNSDGKMDLAVSNFGSNTISVLLGNGDGTFAPKTDLTTGTNPAYIVSGDFNRDGKSDLAVANFGSNSVSVFQGQGNGSFSSKSDFPTGTSPIGIATADFNGDGKLDLAVTNLESNSLSILLGRGEGSFGAKVDYNLADLDSDPMFILATDFNGDGKTDLAISMQNWVAVLLGKGDGSFVFGKPVSNHLGGGAGLAAADFNFDGNVDLVVVNRGSKAVFLHPGNGGGSFGRYDAFGTGNDPIGVVAGAFSSNNKLDVVVANAGSDSISSLPNRTTFTFTTVPIVLSASGLKNSYYTSELTLTNRGTVNAIVEFTYTAAFGGGGGTAAISLPAGKQLIYPDAIAFLRDLKVPIPESGNRGGTLLVKFSVEPYSPSTCALTVRTTTRVQDPEGRAGLAYADVHAVAALTEPSYICGLRQNDQDRSNVAILHAGRSQDSDIVLRLTVYNGDPANFVKQQLPDETLSPGGFKQFTEILSSGGISFGKGFVKIERISGSAPYFAYGVINDQSNSDGSYILPIRASAQYGIHRLTLPVIVETPRFSSELILTNLTTIQRKLRLDYVTGGTFANLPIDLGPGELLIIPDFVNYLRGRFPAIGPVGSTYAGALFATAGDDDVGDTTAISLSARTSTPGGGGKYGLYYDAVPDGQAANTKAWLYGLQQNAENRTNLAIVNTGQSTGNADAFQIDLYDGETGQKVKTVEGIEVEAWGWRQIDGILNQIPGTTQGYACVRRVSGSNPFIAYAVINDGARAGERSGDGAFIQMERDDR